LISAFVFSFFFFFWYGMLLSITWIYCFVSALSWKLPLLDGDCLKHAHQACSYVVESTVMQRLKTALQCSKSTKMKTLVLKRENTFHSRTIAILINYVLITTIPAQINALKLPVNFQNPRGRVHYSIHS